MRHPGISLSRGAQAGRLAFRCKGLRFPGEIVAVIGGVALRKAHNMHVGFLNHSHDCT